VLEGASNNREILQKLSENYWAEMNALIEYTVNDWKRQQNQIEQKKRDAQLAASDKKAGSATSLAKAWSTLGIFVVLILLLTLFKIERNLRKISAIPLVSAVIGNEGTGVESTDSASQMNET
jgi:site-specific recombinase XerC